MRPMDVIPVSRTASPYSLTEAVSELTTNTADTDTASLNQSLDTLSATLDQVAPQLGPTFDGLTRLSQAINDRDDTLGELFKDGADVTKILSDRSQQVNTLILNANDLVAVLSDRRYAIVELLAHTSALSTQLSGFDPRERAGAGADAGQAQRRHGDPGEEPRQHRAGAARVGEVPDHSWRDDRQRAVLPGVHPQPRYSASCCNPSWTMRSGSGAASTPDSRQTMPAPAPNFRSRTTGFPGPVSSGGVHPRERKSCREARARRGTGRVAHRRCRRCRPADIFPADGHHRELHHRHRDLPRRRGPHRRGEGRHHRVDPTGRHSGRDDAARRSWDSRACRRQGGDRRPEPRLGALCPTHACV